MHLTDPIRLKHVAIITTAQCTCGNYVKHVVIIKPVAETAENQSVLIVDLPTWRIERQRIE